MEGALMTRRECLLKAEQCEAMARSSSDEIDRRMLRVTAEQWRNLAAAAEVIERSVNALNRSAA